MTAFTAPSLMILAVDSAKTGPWCHVLARSGTREEPGFADFAGLIRRASWKAARAPCRNIYQLQKRRVKRSRRSTKLFFSRQDARQLFLPLARVWWGSFVATRRLAPLHG
ncbi:MAG TPA: hypothetical protein VFK92_03125 [Burkholderiales bacterium]|nr:hypothetical protein [Burkholderiales bacterium]